MTYTMTRNPQFDSLEIVFDGKPVEAIRNVLKSFGFKWNRKKSLWYGYGIDEDIMAALDNAAENQANSPTAVETVNKSTDRTKELMPLFKECLSEVWSGRMIDYCLKKPAQLVQLDNGMLIEIDKETIKTSFCFDDSWDYDGAIRMADHAAKSEEYFKMENLKVYQNMIQEIDNYLNGTGWPRPFFYLRTRYCGESESNPLKAFEETNLGSFLDAMGGSANLEELKGTIVETKYFSCPFESGKKIYFPTDKDLQDIREGYVRALEAHKKKVEAYLKRYGMSKVRTWTYWGNA